MKAIQCLLLESGKVATGFVEELERVYRVTGFYLELELTEQMNGQAEARGKITYKAFSPVGGMVSTLDIPKNRVAGFQTLPVGVVHNLQYMLDAEVRNADRKRELLARQIPGRTGISPEDWLASIAQHVDKHGVLPQGAHMTKDHLLTSGVFDVIPTSPYREEQK